VQRSDGFTSSKCKLLRLLSLVDPFDCSHNTQNTYLEPPWSEIMRAQLLNERQVINKDIALLEVLWSPSTQSTTLSPVL
jgi:hypothetical protein